MKNILSLNSEELKSFFLKHESYINVDLPPYIRFDNLLSEINKHLDIKNELNNLKRNSQVEDKQKLLQPKDFENVNYKLLHNKNGKYDWRPFQLIHPVLYVSLVREITKNWEVILERFQEVNSNNNIVECMSLPIVSESDKSDKAEQILNWWEQIEQKSIQLSLDFNYIYHTDITDCYGSIYTHSIPWALHSKEVAKEKRLDKSLIGNIIDTHIQAMSFGQTNGIPQGSVLMDFIAEIVLVYADLELTQKINHIEKNDFKIIRYRDDYRIFVNSPQIADEIIKNLSEVLIELGLKLHSQKTTFAENIINSSIKADKMDWLTVNKNVKTIQKRLLIIHNFSLKYPNSGTSVKELQNILKKIHQKQELQQRENIQVLISIVVDIAYLNPKTYSISIAVLSSLLILLEKDEIASVVTKIIKKFKTIPNTGHMQIWLQRAIVKLDLEDDFFDEMICKLVIGHKIDLWNNDWLQDEVKNIFDTYQIIDDNILDTLDKYIHEDEVLLFGEHSL
ncbi:MAG: RNA-directed DNA polymerase [Sulfuricurvum sp.]